ncbi:MAG: PatB family C-S lyase [Pseudomonadota bacterium]
MTDFDFDQPINRREVPALKTHHIVLGKDGDDLFPGSVADMDFRVAPPIIDALQRRLTHQVFGYEAVPDGLIEALQDWQARRHGWTIPTDHILRAPSALNVLAIAASLFSEPGDGIIVQPPVFFDFFNVIRETGRRVVSNPLILEGGYYEMDFEGLARLARDPSTKILFLCNPHNPVGRVWTRDELRRLSGICRENNVLVVSDELHGDIVYPGHTHVPFASISDTASANSLTILSPAKPFNIASCCSAFTIVPDAGRRQAFESEDSRLTVIKNNAFANVAMEAAFRDGEPWLDAVIAYLLGNLAVVRDAIAPLETVHMIEPEATFLVWLDFRGLKLTTDALHAFLRQEARWAAMRGSSFGPEGTGFMRLSIATPKARLESALEDLTAALKQV